MATTQITMDPKFKQDLEAIAKSMTALGKSLSNALSGGNDVAGGLKTQLAQVAETAKKLTDEDLGKIKTQFQGIGKELKLSENKMTAFAEKQTKAFQTNATSSLMSDLRAVQKQAEMSAEQMRAYMGSIKVPEDVIAQFTAKSDMQWWFEDRAASLEDLAASLAEGTDKKFAEFYDDTIPNAMGKASDAFADLFSGISRGTQSSSELFKAMGASMMQVADDIAADFLRLSMRMALFGSKEDGTGGLLGGLIGGIGSWFNRGSSPSSWTDLNAGVDEVFSGQSLFGFAKGNVFAAPALAAYANSIVVKPTFFPFAKGYAPRIGLMGEAGAEAIIPLRRDSGGRLGVDASGIGGQAPQVNVVVNTPPGVGVKEQERKPNGQGGFDMTILLEMVDKHVASGISSGRSKTARAMSARGI